MRKVLLIGVSGAVAGAVLFVASGCGEGSSSTAAPAIDAAPPTCPQEWKVGWQRLANKVKAPVYCASWLPQPLDGRFDGVFNRQIVDPDRSYFIKYLWFDPGLPGGPQEVHVILRGQPGNPRLPECDNSTVEGGTVVHHFSPCFSDPKGKRRFGSKVATLYTSNQGADQWHLLYAWREHDSLYTLSEHVTVPYTYKQVLANLDRMMRTLVRIKPSDQPKT